LIESALKSQFRTTTVDQWKKIIINLVKQSQLSTESFLQTKLAVVVVELAKRIWPADWIDMNLLLIEMFQQSPASQAMCLNILKSLAEDIFIYDDVTFRKKELSTAFIAIALDPATADKFILKITDNSETITSSRLDLNLLLKYTREGSGTKGWMSVLIEMFIGQHSALMVAS
jgi:Exportin 1-like protein